MTPSILSSKPPWPGKMDPVSFKLAFLLRSEITKSPNWHTKDKNKLKNIRNKIESISKENLISISKTKVKMVNGKSENTKDPIDPEIVLFGLILVNFLPPIDLPITNPPISENIQIDKIKIKSVGGDECILKLEKIKTKKNIKIIKLIK